jgi:signal peptidase I
VSVPIDERVSGARIASVGLRRPRMRGLSIAAIAFGSLFGVRAIAIEPVRVESTSMEPTMHAGQTVLADKLSLRVRGVRRGEIVELRDPRTGDALVKRVVAIGGDSIGIDDGRLVRNGTVIDEAYVDRAENAGRFYGPVTVPAGHVFVLGDHRMDSVDSRRFGPVRESTLRARIVQLPFIGR